MANFLICMLPMYNPIYEINLNILIWEFTRLVFAMDNM